MTNGRAVDIYIRDNFIYIAVLCWSSFGTEYFECPIYWIRLSGYFQNNAIAALLFPIA